MLQFLLSLIGKLKKDSAPNLVLHPGTNYIGKAQLAAYNTGSGNYVGCFLPVDTSHITRVTSASINNVSAVFTDNGKVEFSQTTESVTNEVSTTGVFFEFPYPSTQSSNKNATILVNGFTIVCE